MSYVISAEYGELIEGVAALDVEISTAIRNGHTDQLRALMQERADWADVMQRCPMFVQDEGRAHA